MGSITKIAEKCMNCSELEKCTHKYMEACAYIDEPCNMPNTVSSAIQNMQPMIEPHNYVNIKVGEETSITMDVEKIKQQIKDNFYKQMGLSIGV